MTSNNTSMKSRKNLSVIQVDTETYKFLKVGRLVVGVEGEVLRIMRKGEDNRILCRNLGSIMPADIEMEWTGLSEEGINQ